MPVSKNYRFEGSGGTETLAQRFDGRSQLTRISGFCREGEQVFRAYSCYSRGLDMLNAAYHCLDLVPMGRDEDGLPHTTSWLRCHDEYDR